MKMAMSRLIAKDVYNITIMLICIAKLYIQEVWSANSTFGNGRHYRKLICHHA